MLRNYKFSKLLCLLAISSAEALFAGAGPDWSRLVVVGDSLSAGVQNFSLLDVDDNPPTGLRGPLGQQHGYASLLANQVGTSLTLPLISSPGLPNVLGLVSLGPPPIIAPVPGGPPSRENETTQNTNVSVPGVTVNQALTVRPTPAITQTTPAVQIFATYVLGFPSLLEGKAPTEIELATQLKPTTVIEWLGNNDVLVPALVGQLQAITPIESFAIDYNAVLDKLAATGARIVTANIPDVTEISYFMSADQIAQEYGRTTSEVREMLGINPGDKIRITGAGLVDQILTGGKQGPIQQYTCPSPEPGLTTSGIPCVLTADQAFQVRSAVSCYNLIIAAESFAHGALMVDIKSLVDNLYQNGYTVDGETLNLDFLGGIASLDGIHPTNSGYAIIANRFIDTINDVWRTNIPEVNIHPIVAQDPLVFRAIIREQNPQHALPTPGSCLADLSKLIPQ